MNSPRRKSGVLAVAVAVLLGSVGLASPPASAAAAPAPLQSVNPVRLFDTRPGQATADGQGVGIGQRASGSVTRVPIAGRGGVPVNADAVIINLTAVRPSTDAFLTVFECGREQPKTSTLNAPAGDNRANSALVKLAGDGTVCVYTTAKTHFIVDLSGFVPAGGTPKAIYPARLADTRPGQKTSDGKSAGLGQRPAGSVTKVQIAGRGGVPRNASAAMLNLTAVLPSASTYLSAYPCGTKRPNVSNLNSPAGDIRANSAVVKLAADGSVCVYTEAATNFIIDISGYVPAGGTPNTINPARFADTRPGKPTIDGKFAGIKRRGPDTITQIKIAGRGGVPANATSAMINLTAVLPTRGTYLTAYPCDATIPNVSTVNAPAGDIRANSAFVQLSNTGTVCVYTVAATDFIIDVSGYSTPPVVPPPPPCMVNGVRVTTALPSAECQALAVLYTKTQGANWIHNQGWMTKTDPCTWYGVNCVSGHVAELVLAENNLTGPVPAEIGNLSGLVRLYFWNNRITSVPPQIGQLSHLEFLDLPSNELRSVPPEIGNLTTLAELHLDANQLRSLPPEISRLTGLWSFSAVSNQLTTLPVELNYLIGLGELRLTDNNLCGDITAVFTPFMKSNSGVELNLAYNPCLSTTDPALAEWLTRKSPGWNTPN